MGNHVVKTWSCRQGAYALSSAEADLYSMEGVARAKELRSLASELGSNGVSNVVYLGTDSSAAKSFVCRRGLGKMRHEAIRDLWLQQGAQEKRLELVKISGTSNPADLMTKSLTLPEIEEKLSMMNMKMIEDG